MTSSEIPTGIPSKKIRILFLAWGYSIHAQRRIQLFADDPLFEVAVVSTYDYRLSPAITIPLSNAGKTRKAPDTSGGTGHFSPYKNLKKVAYPFTLASKFIGEIITSFRDFRILKNAVDTIQPDVIFLQTLLYPNYLVYLLKRRAPVIITFWNGDVTWWAKWTGIERLLKKNIIIHGVKIASAITVNSTTAFNACIGYGKPAKDIHLIPYPGIDCSIFRPIDTKSAREYISCNASRIVFWPRGIGDYLNFDTLVSASRDILKTYPDLHFIVLHPNRELDASITEGLTRDGIGKNFTFLQRIPFEDMPYYYSASDMMISISSNDSLPNTMLEAMACGCPVIMGDIPQIRDWVTDGKNGYLCPVRDPGLLAQCIRKIIENHEHMNEKFIKENLELIAGKVDSRKMSIMIKNLVMDVSSRSKEI